MQLLLENPKHEGYEDERACKKMLSNTEEWGEQHDY